MTDERENTLYVPLPEAPEQMAERQARYAAEGRDRHGTLLKAEPPCQAFIKPQKAPISQAERERLLSLWGAKLGSELIREADGASLDDLYGAEMQAAWDDWCSARERIAGEIAAEEARQMAEVQRLNLVEKAIQEARRNLKRGEQVQKNGRLCTRLYSCVGDKRSGGAKPSTMHVSSECFTHRDHQAGKIRDDCPFLHPGDAGWHEQWLKNRLWIPAGAQQEPVRQFGGGDRFASLTGGQKRK